MTGVEASFVGRVDELDAIAAAADRARSGHATTVFVTGEAGSGKSTLVRRAIAQLTDFQLSSAPADELATHLAYGVVEQLQPVAAESSPFAVGLELLQTLSAGQSDGPVLLVLEDLHWADNESRLALLTAVRRLGHDHVLTLVASRPDRRDATDGWERFRFEPQSVAIQPGGFSADEVAALAESVGVTLGPRHAERLRRHTEGHPLYVRTLLRELTPAQLMTVEHDLPAPRSLSSATLARFAQVSEPALELAAALAVLNERASLAVLGRVSGVDDPTGALDELLATGFVTWSPGEPSSPVAFAHPLYRSAIYEDLAPVRRRRLHLAAAEVSEADRALGHRVAAADQPDAELADALDRAAVDAHAAGRWGSAAQHYFWASEVSPEPALADRRLLDAALSLIDESRSTALIALTSRIVACGPSPRRDIVVAMLAWLDGDADRADRLLDDGARGAETVGELELATDALITHASLYTARTRGADAVEVASRALELAPAGSDLERLAWAAHAMGVGQTEGAARGIDDLARRRPNRPETPRDRVDATLLMTDGTLHFYAGRIAGAETAFRAALEMARRGTAPNNLARVHIYLSQVQYMLGDWDLSVVNARLAVALIHEDPHLWTEAQAQCASALVAAGRGEWENAQHHVDAALDAAAIVNTGEAHYTARIAAAALHRARGEHAQVIADLGPLPRDNAGAAIHMFSSLSWWHTLIAAFIETGDLSTAAEQIEGFDAGASARGIDNRARVADLRGRLAAARADFDGAATMFESALSLLGPDDSLLVKVGVHYEYGRALQAGGDRQAAATQLREARTLLEPVGAIPYLAEVDAILADLGISSRPNADSPFALTDRERDVVTLVATGMTNREVAAELYVSQKAVEYHLRNVFGKLGITSRRQLRDWAGS